MPKSAIINIARPNQIQVLPFKKLALFFDHLYIEQLPLHFARIDIEHSNNLSLAGKRNLLSEIDWLCESKIIVPYHLTIEDLTTFKADEALKHDINVIDEDLNSRLTLAEQSDEDINNEGAVRFAGVVKADNDFIFNAEDVRLRINAAVLNSMDKMNEFVPVLNSLNSYRKLPSPDFAAQFVVSKFPVPGEDTSWEEIINFRNDPEIKRKYYALLKWINEIGGKNLPAAHIIDEYNQLYSEYLRQYSLHKLTTGFTTLELLVNLGLDVTGALLQQNYLSALKGILSIRKQQVSLLEKEKQITGRELAYIKSVNEKF